MVEYLSTVSYKVVSKATLARVLGNEIQVICGAHPITLIYWIGATGISEHFDSSEAVLVKRILLE